MVGKLILKKGEDRRIRRGHLWIFSNEVASMEIKQAGDLVHVFDARGRFVATAYANPKTLICARILSKRRITTLDVQWWQNRLQRAHDLRQRYCDTPNYRWVHGDGDSLPGLAIDRFNDQAVVQTHTLGMERFIPDIVEAAKRILPLRNIYLQNQASIRVLEGLPLYCKTIYGEGDGELVVEENGCRFRCHAFQGQKTGYFFDQRPNRKWVVKHAHGKRVLDAFCYVGAFSALCLQGGAKEVWSIDQSETAMKYAEMNIEAVGGKAKWRKMIGEVLPTFAELESLKEKFDIVIVDPPAFIKSRKQYKKGVEGYINLNKHAARLVAPNGLLCTSSCSGLLSPEDFRKTIARALIEAKRRGYVIKEGGAGPDHPWPPAMPELRYLKFMAVHLD